MNSGAWLSFPIARFLRLTVSFVHGLCVSLSLRPARLVRALFGGRS